MSLRYGYHHPLQVFTRLELPGRLAEDISGLAFLSNVRYIDLSNNLIKVRAPSRQDSVLPTRAHTV